MTDTGEPMRPSPAGGTPPRVFTRLISTPPGPFWRQAKMAGLEARQSAPLPLTDVSFRLKRLGYWDGGAARFAALYVRASDFTESFIAEIQVDGAAVRVRMPHPEEERRRRARVVTLTLASTVVVGVLTLGLATAATKRERLAEQLDTAEQQASARMRQAQAIQRRVQEATLLSAASRQDVEIEAVIADLNWAATNRTAEARIQAFHWQNGALAVEARGPNPPIEAMDRPLVRSTKPIRPGVWAWATATQAPIKPSLARPVTSDLR